MTEGEEMSTTQGKVEFERIEPDAIPNPRTDLGDVDGLKEDILQNGLLQPPVVLHKTYGGDGYKMPDGKIVRTRYLLLAGFRRYEALRRIREDDKEAFATVPVILYKGNEDDIIFSQVAENVRRKDLNPIELADAIRNMINRGHKPQAIARRIGLSYSWVSQLLKMREQCSPAIQKALVRGEFGLMAALEIMDMDEAKQDKALVEYKEAKKGGGKGAASKAAKRAVGKTVFPGRRLVTDLYEVVGSEGFDDEYFTGVHDGLGYTLGRNEKLMDKVEAKAKELGLDQEASEDAA